jgi:hypothetical protein
MRKCKYKSTGISEYKRPGVLKVKCKAHIIVKNALVMQIHIALLSESEKLKGHVLMTAYQLLTILRHEEISDLCT